MRDLWGDIDAAHPAWDFAGIVGDQAHSVRVSSHNCGTNQETALRHPTTGQLVDYPDGYAHALDATFWADRLGAAQIRNQLLMGPRRLDVRYVIDHDTGTLYLPEWRGGGTQTAGAGHPHLHISGAPWCTFDGRPWLQREMTDNDRRLIERLARESAQGRRMLRLRRRPYMHGRGVRELQAVLNRPIGLPYGPGTAHAVGDLQEFFGRARTERVDRATWELVLFIYIAHGFGF